MLGLWWLEWIVIFLSDMWKITRGRQALEDPHGYVGEITIVMTFMLNDQWIVSINVPMDMLVKSPWITRKSFKQTLASFEANLLQVKTRGKLYFQSDKARLGRSWVEVAHSFFQVLDWSWTHLNLHVHSPQKRIELPWSLSIYMYLPLSKRIW